MVDGAGAPVAEASALGRTSLHPEDIEDSARLLELDGIGFACVDERAPAACRSHRRTASTDAGGAFALTFGLSEALGASPAVLSAPADPITVAVRVPAEGNELSGPAVSRRILPSVDGFDLGGMTVWDPVVEVTTVNGADARVAWALEAPGAVSGYRVLVEESDGRLIWQETTRGRELTLKLPNLLGTRGAISVVAVGSDSPQWWRSARVPYRADDGSVRPAGTAEVRWPRPADLAPGAVLAGIVAFLAAALLLVTAGNVRHRRAVAALSLVARGHR